jgi:hypothetical protein
MMNAQPRRLPIELVIRRSFLFAWESRAVLMAPLIIYIGLTTIADLVVGQMAGSDNTASMFFLVVAGQVLGAAFAVGIHRFVLLAEAPSGFRFFRWDGNFVQYVIVALLLLVMSVSILLMAAGLTGGDPAAQPSAASGLAALFSLFVMVFAAPAFSRLFLALPSAALGDRVGTRQIWKATEGNGVRLLLASLLVVFPFLVVDALLFVEVLKAGGGAKFLVLELIRGVSAVQMVVWSIMLSLSYDVLVRGGGPPARQTNR